MRSDLQRILHCEFFDISMSRVVAIDRHILYNRLESPLGDP